VDSGRQLQYPQDTHAMIDVDICLILESLLFCVWYLWSDLKYVHEIWSTFQTVIEHVKGVLFQFPCVNKIIPGLGIPEIYNLFIMDYGFYPSVPAN
jgi:hypothetical protein